MILLKISKKIHSPCTSKQNVQQEMAHSHSNLCNLLVLKSTAKSMIVQTFEVQSTNYGIYLQTFLFHQLFVPRNDCYSWLYISTAWALGNFDLHKYKYYNFRIQISNLLRQVSVFFFKLHLKTKRQKKCISMTNHKEYLQYHFGYKLSIFLLQSRNLACHIRHLGIHLILVEKFKYEKYK